MAFLLEKIQTIEGYSRFASLIEEVGLAEVLNGLGQYTIFVPDDNAFEQAPPEILQSYLDDESRKKSLVLHHVCFGIYTETDLCKLESLKNAEHRMLKVADDYAVLRISGARIVSGNIEADNGVFHGIERVLWPSL